MGEGGPNFPISVPYFLTPIPLPHHPPKPFRMNTFKSVSKQKTLTPFRINTYEKQRGEAHFAQFWCNVSPFRINTYKSVSKQRTLTPFRMNTYEKHTGWGVLWLTSHAMRHVYPERPSGAEGCLFKADDDAYPEPAAAGDEA